MISAKKTVIQHNGAKYSTRYAQLIELLASYMQNIVIILKYAYGLVLMFVVSSKERNPFASLA